MTFRMRGIQLPDWDTPTGSAVNRVWLEFLRRERRLDRARVEHDMVSAYALAGSPDGDVEKRFEVAGKTKEVLFSHIDQTVHQTAYKRIRLEKHIRRVQGTIDELERLDWITSDEFNLQDWFEGR